MTRSATSMDTLVRLAREPTSEKRRELLREITDLFLAEEAARHGQAGGHADHILTHLITQANTEARREVAERLSDGPAVPEAAAQALVLDELEVAAPLLLGKAPLPRSVLLHCAKNGGQGHLSTLAARAALDEAVCSTIVERGGVATLRRLLANETARIDRKSFEVLTDKAQATVELRSALVAREDAPVDLLHELYFLLDHADQRTVLDRAQSLSREQCDALFAAARARLKQWGGAVPSDYDDAVRWVEGRKLRRRLDGEALVQCLELGQETRFLTALAELSGLSFGAVQRLSRNRVTGPLATACRAAGLDRDAFVSVALLRRTDGSREHTDPESLRTAYDQVSPELANQVLRFWRVRAQAEHAEDRHSRD